MSEEHKDIVNEFEDRRIKRLDKAKEELEELLAEFSDDSNMSHDIKENSARDAILAKINSQQQLIAKLESSNKIPHIPGTWNLGDKLFVKYTRIVSYNKDQKVPEKRIKIQLVDELDITTIDDSLNIESIELMPTAINTPLGEALLHKAHNTVRYDTPVGYCEVEVERCLV